MDWRRIKKLEGRISDIKRDFIEKEDGMGVVEIILIIVVLIGLATMFKTEINSVVKSIFISIKTQVGSF